MASAPIHINTIRRNLVMIRSHLREASRRVDEGSIYEETVLIVRKHIEAINDLLHPTH